MHYDVKFCTVSSSNDNPNPPHAEALALPSRASKHVPQAPNAGCTLRGPQKGGNLRVRELEYLAAIGSRRHLQPLDRISPCSHATLPREITVRGAPTHS